MPGGLGSGQLGGITVPTFTPLGAGLPGALDSGAGVGHENTLFGSNEG